MAYGKTKVFSVLLLISLVVLGLFLAGCKQQPKEEVVKIGVITDLSGPSAWIGEYQRKGIDLAVSEINNRGGISGKRVKVFYEDDRANPSEAISAFNNLLMREKPDSLIISLSAVANSLIPLINENNIPSFLVAVSLPGITDKSKWVFRAHVGSDDEAKITAEFLKNKFPKINSAAVVYVNDEFGVGGAKVFKQEFPGKVAVNEAFSKTQSDFKTIITKIKGSDAEVIYIIGYTLAVPNLLKQLREMGVELPVITNLAIGSPSFIKASGEAVNGIYLPALLVSYKNPRDPVIKKFVDDYKERYNEDPSLFSAFSYTAVKMLESAIQKEGDSASSIRSGVFEIKDFRTPVGKINVLPNGNIRFPLKMVQIINGSFIDVFIPK